MTGLQMLPLKCNKKLTLFIYFVLKKAIFLNRNRLYKYREFKEKERLICKKCYYFQTQ